MALVRCILGMFLGVACHAMDALFEEAFGSVLAPEDIIPISEEEIYQQHVMSLYSRIKRIESKSRQEVSEEVLESNEKETNTH